MNPSAGSARPTTLGSEEPGRRYVTLLFADLSRSTELVDAMEAEHYGALLAELRRSYNEIVPRHGGLVVRVQGDGLLAMFGHPQTREDDARRAVDAALALHAHVRQMRFALPDGFALSLHSGVHGGLVLIGAGDIERGRFELMGPVPNIAARLSDAAGPHEVLVSQATIGPAARHFETSAPFALKLKGRDEPVEVVKVEPRLQTLPGNGTTAAGRRRDAALVGRDAELAALSRCLATAAAGCTQIVAVVGAAGVGKTRLVQGAIARAQTEGWRTWRCHCDADLGAEPMQPFVQLLRELDANAPAQAVNAAQALAALKLRLTELATMQPALIFIDDWQWADDASHQVLLGLRQLESCRLAVLLTTRPADASPRAAPTQSALAHHSIALGPLGDGEAHRLAARRLPGVDPFVIGEVCRHAGGNPLFIDELAHLVQRAGLTRETIARAGGMAGTLGLSRVHGAASWISQLVQSRVEDLPSEQAELVRAAAVVGNVLPLWMLEHLSGRGAGDPALRALAEQDLLFPGEREGTLRFKHGLTRDIIYESVGLHARQLLHLRVAAAMQHRAHPQVPPPRGGALAETPAAPEAEALEALAYHFDMGGEHSLAAHYAELAGDRALAASALDRARAQYRTALSALERLTLSPERARRWLSIVQRLCMVVVFDPARADLALVQRALVLAEQQDDLALRARARYWLGYIHYALGEAPQAVHHGELALQQAKAAHDEPLAFQVVATLGEAMAAAAQYGRALELLDQAIEVKRRHRSGRRTNIGLAFSLVCRACVLGDRGLFDDAEAQFAEALMLVMGEEHEIAATIHGWRAGVLLWRGHWAAARAAAIESGRIANVTRSLAQFSIARAIEGYARWVDEGDLQGMALIEEATAWLEPRETGIFRSLNHGWLTEGLMAQGRRAEARQRAALALQRARQRDLLGAAMSQRALAQDFAHAQRFDLAQRCIERAYAIAHTRDSAHERAVTQWTQARIALAQDQVGAAHALLDGAGEAFERMGMHWHLARVQSEVKALA